MYTFTFSKRYFYSSTVVKDSVSRTSIYACRRARFQKKKKQTPFSWLTIFCFLMNTIKRRNHIFVITVFIHLARFAK